MDLDDKPKANNSDESNASDGSKAEKSDSETD